VSPREINARVKWEYEGGRIVGVDAPEELGPVIRDEIARRVPVMAPRATPGGVASDTELASITVTSCSRATPEHTRAEVARLARRACQALEWVIAP